MTSNPSVTFADLRVPRRAHVYEAASRLRATDIKALLNDVLGVEAKNKVSLRARDSGSTSEGFLIRSHHPSAAFAPPGRLEETRYSLVLVVATRTLILVYAVGCRWSDKFLTNLGTRLPQVKVEQVLARNSSIFERVSLLNMSVARNAIQKRTYEADSLETAIPSLGLGRTIVRSARVKANGRQTAASLGTGLLSSETKNKSVNDYSSWAKDLAKATSKKTTPTGFISYFARPVRSLPGGVEPNGILLDLQFLRDASAAAEVTVSQKGKAADASILSGEAVRALCERFSELGEVGTSISKDRWEVTFPFVTKPGELRKNKVTFSFTHPDLMSLRLQWAGDDGWTTLTREMFERTSLRVTTTDLRYVFAQGQVFEDRRICAELPHIAQIIEAQPILAKCKSEKGKKRSTTRGFSAKSAFSAIETTIAKRGSLLVCDDFGDEWADFIEIDPIQRRVAFYHAKHKRDETNSASAFHDLIGQALKNLGRLAVVSDELRGKQIKWEGNWIGTAIPRIRSPMGSSAANFIKAYDDVNQSPSVLRQVCLVTTFLSKTKLDDMFAAAKVTHKGRRKLRPNEFQLIHLLASFLSACRDVGAEPRVICAP